MEKHIRKHNRHYRGNNNLKISVHRNNMFIVGVVMLSYLASKALVCRDLFCESVPFCLLSMATGAYSQHIDNIMERKSLYEK